MRFIGPATPHAIGLARHPWAQAELLLLAVQIPPVEHSFAVPNPPALETNKLGLAAPTVPNFLAVTNPPAIERNTPGLAAPAVPNFRTAEHVFAAKSTRQLLSTWAVLTACSQRALVDNGELLIDWSNRTLGRQATNSLIEHTFFRHFCGGGAASSAAEALKIQIHPITSLVHRLASGQMESRVPRLPCACRQGHRFIASHSSVPARAWHSGHPQLRCRE